MASGRGGAWRRALRRPFDQDTRAEGDGVEGGFTLIELMVVLLIMAILLAIAIPTFLGVTHGAQKTSTQSDLTTALTSAGALYVRDQRFPVAGTATAAETMFLTAMRATQTTLEFLGPSTSPNPATNQLSSYDPNTGQLAVFSGKDGDTICWIAVENRSAGPITVSANTFPPGDSFAAYQDPPLGHGLPPTTSTSTTSASVLKALSKSRTFYPSFSDIQGFT